MVCVFCLTIALPCTALAVDFPINMQMGSPVTIKVESPFSFGPSAGYTELVVRIKNGMSRDGTWYLKIDAQQGYHVDRLTFSTEAKFEVPANQQRSFTISVPLPDYNLSAYTYPSFSGKFSGDYTEYSGFDIQIADSSSVSFDGFLLLSPELYRKHGSELEAYYNKKGAGYCVANYYHNPIPEDWRCYVGFDMFLTTVPDWQALSRGSRKAILEAVAAGHLELRFRAAEFNKDMAAEFNMPADAKSWRYGLGTIHRYNETLEDALLRMEQSGTAPNGMLEAKSSKHLQEERLDSTKIHKGQSSESPIIRLEDLLGDKTPPAGFLTLLMIGIGILIGPVNYFVFARKKHSLRLFITTPLIAAGTSLVLLIWILLSDGVGGTGYISRVIYLGDNPSQLYVEQEQVADTGLYFAKPFEFAGLDWLVPRGSAINQMDYLENRGTFNQRGGMHSGNWFASKRLQAMSARTYIASREGIELVPQSGAEAPPKVFSNFRGICDVFYYIDAEKSVWKGENLQLGAEQTLRKIDKGELLDWFREQSKASGMNMELKLRGFGLQPEHFYASVSNWQMENVETVSNIRWKMHTQLLIGRLANSTNKGGAE